MSRMWYDPQSSTANTARDDGDADADAGTCGRLTARSVGQARDGAPTEEIKGAGSGAEGKEYD